MHPIPFVIFLMLLIVILAQFSGRRATGNGVSISRDFSEDMPSGGKTVAFLSDGKLFYKTTGGHVEQVITPSIQTSQDGTAQQNALSGHHKNTGPESDITGTGNGIMPPIATISFKTAVFVDEDIVVYFLSDGNSGGLFEQNLITGEETHLLPQQRLNLDQLHYDAINDRILCSSESENGIRYLASIDRVSNHVTHYGPGDTLNTMPCSVPGKPEKMVVQTSDTARDEAGNRRGIGPASLNLLSTDTQQLENIVCKAQFDFVQPYAHPNGNLFYIRRPYENPNVNLPASVQDLFRNPLANVTGLEPRDGRKSAFIHSTQIDAKKAHRLTGNDSGVPSPVPKSWQLISRNKHGQETVMATNVASFDISTGGKVIYTNGIGVFEVTNEGSKLLFRDTLVEQVLVW